MLGDLVWGPGSTSVLTLEGHEYIQCFDLVVVVVVSRVSTCVETHLMMCFEYRVLCQLYPNKVGLKKKNTAGVNQQNRKSILSNRMVPQVRTTQRMVPFLGCYQAFTLKF